MSEANAKAEKLVKDARAKSQNIVDSYQSQIAEKEKELEMMKREVTAFRASLYEIYRSHIAVIEKIPEYDFDDEDTEAATPAPAAPKAIYAPQPVEEPEEEEEIPVPAAAAQEEPEEEPAPEPVKAEPAPAAEPEPETYDKDAYIKEQFNGIGLDLNAYADIPETLQKEKESLFSTLEFGIEDTTKKKGKFKRR